MIALAAWLSQRHQRAQGEGGMGPRPPLLPWFAVAFAVLVTINSTGWLPAPVVHAGQGASQWCLVMAMAAIGMKTHMKDILTVGWKPVALMVLETLFLAVLFYGMLVWMRS
ncbi:putative sulfate exporter family transporter [Cupriavidus lacunae]|nr:putative sulfate exporter family transporter [Cupriavidus lacunae]